MAAVLPNVIGMIFANSVLIDPNKGDISLVGIFEDKDFFSFPTTQVEMVVFIMVNGGRGNGLFELTVFALDELGEHDLEDWIYRKRKRYAFPNDNPNRILNVEIPIKSLRFPEVGDYLFVLTLDGNPIAERRMFVHEVK